MKAFIHIFTIILQILYSFNCFALNDLETSNQASQCLAPKSSFPSVTIIGASKVTQSEAGKAKKTTVSAAKKAQVAKASVKSLDAFTFNQAKVKLDKLISFLRESRPSLRDKISLNSYRTAYYSLFYEYQDLSFKNPDDENLKNLRKQLEIVRSNTEQLLYPQVKKGVPFRTSTKEVYMIPGTKNNTIDAVYRGFTLEKLLNMFGVGNKGNDDYETFENLSDLLFRNGEEAPGNNYDVMDHLSQGKSNMSGLISTSSSAGRANFFASRKENDSKQYSGLVMEIDPDYIEAVFSRHYIDSQSRALKADPKYADFMDKYMTGYRKEMEVSVARRIPAEAIISCTLVDSTGTPVTKKKNPSYKALKKDEGAASKDIGEESYSNVEIVEGRSRPATDKENEVVNRWIEGMKSKLGSINSLYKDYPNVDIEKTLQWLNRIFSLKDVNINVARINGGEAKFELKNKELNIYLDPKKVSESTLFHEMFEAAFSMANPGLQNLAHSFTFMTESSLYQESMSRKLSRYDDLKLSELIDNTEAEINAINEQAGLSEELRNKKKDQANAIKNEAKKMLLSKLASPSTEGEDNYTLAEIIKTSQDAAIRNAAKGILVNRLALLQDGYLSEKAKGGRTIVRNYDLNQETDVQLFAQFFEDMENQKDYLTRNDDFQGMFRMDVGDEKTHLVSGVALSGFDIQQLMRNENGWIIEKGDVSNVSSSERIVNGNPRIRLVNENGITRLRFILSDKTYDLEKVTKEKADQKDSEEKTPEDVTKSGPAFEDFIKLLKTKSIVFSKDSTGVIYRANPKKNTNEIETVKIENYRLDLADLLTGVTSFASLQSIIGQKLSGIDAVQSRPIRQALNNIILETWALVQKTQTGPSGASKTIGSDISSLMADTPEGIYFDKQLEDFTAAEKAKLEQFQKSIISKTPAIKTALTKLNLDPSLADLIGKAFDMNDPTIRLLIQKAKNGIQGAEAVYYNNGLNAEGNKTILMVLDSGFDESTLFHELIESILEDSLGDKAHGYTFILESEVYKDSTERKLKNYDVQQLRNIVLNTNSELERLDSLEGIPGEVKEIKKQNARDIQMLAMKMLSEMSEFSSEKVSDRINKLQDEKNIGISALIRQFKIDNTMDTLKTRLMLTQFLDSIDSSTKINKKDYTGNMKYQLSLEKDKLPVTVNGIGLNRDDILNIMRNPTYVSFLQGDISKYTGYDMVNGNPHIWHKDGKLFFVLSDQSYAMTEIERTRNLKSSLDKEMETEEVEKATNGAAFADFMKILKSKSVNLYRQGNGFIFHVNERKNIAQKQQYDLIDAGLDFSDISDNVSFNTLKELLTRKINSIADANKRRLMEAGLQKLILDTWATVQKMNGLQTVGASKIIGTPTVSTNKKNIAPVTDIIFSDVIQFNGMITTDDIVFSSRIQSFLQNMKADRQKLDYAKKVQILLNMLKQKADAIAMVYENQKIISSAQTAEVATSIFSQLTKSLVEGNQCNLNAPLLLNSYIQYRTDFFTDQQKKSLVLQIGDTNSNQVSQETEWQSNIIDFFFSDMTGSNIKSIESNSSVNTNMFMLLATNAAMKEAVGAIEGQEICRTNDFLFTNIFDSNSIPLNESTGSVQFSA